MSNSHPLHPFFMPFEPVAHPLQAVVLAMVPLLFPTVSEAVHSDWNVLLLCGAERPPTICKTSSNLLLPAANTAIVALPPSGVARSQVDQGRRRGYHQNEITKLPQCNV